MTVRLPTPGGDQGAWADILNAFLLAAHNADGTLNTAAVQTALGGALPLNVKSYGALGDGSTDDSAAVAAAAAAATPGQVVYFPATASGYAVNVQAAFSGLSHLTFEFAPGAYLLARRTTYTASPSYADAAFHFLFTNCHHLNFIDLDLRSADLFSGDGTGSGVKWFKFNGACHHVKMTGRAERVSYLAYASAFQGDFDIDVDIYDPMSVTEGNIAILFDATLDNAKGVTCRLGWEGPGTYAYVDKRRRFPRGLYVLGQTAGGQPGTPVNVTVEASRVYAVCDLSQNPVPSADCGIAVATAANCESFRVRGQVSECGANHPYDADSGKTGTKAIGYTDCGQVDIDVQMAGVDFGVASGGSSNHDLRLAGQFSHINDVAGNYFETALASAIVAGDLSLTYDATAIGTSPTAPFRIFVESETIIVGAINTGTKVMSSLTRGADGTTAASHAAGIAVIYAAFTRGNVAEVGDQDTSKRLASEIGPLTVHDPHGNFCHELYLRNMPGMCVLNGVVTDAIGKTAVNVHGVEHLVVRASGAKETSVRSRNSKGTVFAPISIADGPTGFSTRFVEIGGDCFFKPVGGATFFTDTSAAAAIKGRGAFTPAASLPPTKGSWRKNDIVVVDGPAAHAISSYLASADGSLDTLGATTATGNNAQSRLTLSSMTGIYVGLPIVLSGGGLGSAVSAVIERVDAANRLVWINQNLPAGIAGATVTVAAPTFRPDIDRASLVAQGWGLKGWAFDPGAGTIAAATTTSQQAFWTLVYLNGGETINNVLVSCETAYSLGPGTIALVKVAVYSVAAAKVVAVSGDQQALYSTVGMKPNPLSAAYTPAAGWYYLGWLYVAGGTPPTTAPVVGRGGNNARQSVAIGTGIARSGVTASLADIAVNDTPAITGSNPLVWVGWN